MLYSWNQVYLQTTFPKREVRAVWIATVVNLDWPSSRWGSTQSQKNELVSIFDELQETGINCVFFQIRTECDALYASAYDPWSYWLTGQQGSSPSPYYDPLQFAIEEAHQRNMELHAWFNPYRAERSVGSYSIDPLHVSVQHPDWVLQIGNFKFLDPGLPMVREYVNNVIMDVVTNYDVDGIHFDDYFYPYPPNNITNEDNATFSNYNRGFTNIEDWRRDNVNLLVESIYDSINNEKQWVKFGISPFGIWKNNVPPGIMGTSSYYDIYCDPIAWLNGHYIDYVNPQLYWQISGPQDYSLLMPWWGSVSNNRHIYTGNALYKMTTYHNWPAQEIANQIRLNRQEPGVKGCVFFRSSYITNNTKGIADTLKNDLFKYYSLNEPMAWKDSIPPESPTDLLANNISGGIRLQWDQPALAVDGDSAESYVLYRFAAQDSMDIENPQFILAIQNGNSFEYIDNEVLPNEQYTYIIASLDKLQNESITFDTANIIYTGIDAITFFVPYGFDLKQNWPNPFNSSTKINFSIMKSAPTTLKVYNILGREIKTLLDTNLEPGEYSINYNSENLASGIYYYSLVSADRSMKKKMMLIK